MKSFEYTVFFDAVDDADAEHLVDAMLGGLGCTDDPEHECPHFRLGLGPGEIADTRLGAWRILRRNIRWALVQLIRGF